MNTSWRCPLAALLVIAACTGSSGNSDSTPTPPSSLPSSPTEDVAAPGGPNILVILTDDQRLGTMSVMPSTAALFREGGTEFVNAYATTPLCCPARASIFTGLYVHNHGVRGNLDAAVLDQSLTIQRYLRDAGYATGYTGKFLNSWDLAKDPDHFDRWAIFNRGYFDLPWNVDGEARTVAQYSTDFVSDRAVEFLRDFEADDDRPWFLFVAPYAPHEPWFPEPDYAEDPVPPWFPGPAVQETDLSDKPPVVQQSNFARDGLLSLEDVVEMRGEQLRTLFSVDEMVDRLFGLLEELGEEEDTLAFFLSDNGFLWGEHGLAGVGDDTGKRYPYTQSVKVPMFMRWPAHVQAGTTDDRIVANIDLAPTIMEAAGLATVGPAMDGRSLLEPGSREEILLEYFRDESFETVPSWASIRTLEFQYVEWYTDDLGRVTFREYYDLRADPFQLENLLADGDPSNDPDVDALSERLAEERRCSGLAGDLPCP